MPAQAEKLHFIVLTTTHCPTCGPTIQLLKKTFPDAIVEEINLDREPKKGSFIAMEFGFVDYDPDRQRILGIPVPQVFLVTRDGIHFLSFGFPETLTPEEIKAVEKEVANAIKRRVDMILRGVAKGKYFLYTDIKDNLAVEPDLEKRQFVIVSYLLKWVKFRESLGLLAKTRAFGRDIYVDLEYLGRLIERKFECLCVKGRRCPCEAFIKAGICQCGVFFVVDMEELKRKADELAKSLRSAGGGRQG